MLMTDSESGRIAAIETAVSGLTAAVGRLEMLIREEIQDLKREQIADLRKNNERLADDQRRAWEAIREMENQRSHDRGGFKVAHAALSLFVGIIGAILGAFLARFH